MTLIALKREVAVEAKAFAGFPWSECQVSLNILKQEDILFTDIRFEPYANVIFDHNIYEARKTVRDYLFSLGIETIGRFGKWGYLWSDQSLMSGLKVEM